MLGRVLTALTVAAAITSAASAQDVKWPVIGVVGDQLQRQPEMVRQLPAGTALRAARARRRVKRSSRCGRCRSQIDSGKNEFWRALISPGGCC